MKVDLAPYVHCNVRFAEDCGRGENLAFGTFYPQLVGLGRMQI